MDLLAEMVVFAKVVDLRSFSSAARQLGLTHSAVSRSVARLEAHLGVKLLHRTTRSLSPTDLGRDVVEHCALISQTARDVCAIAQRHALAPTGRLSISAPIVLGQRWLMPRLPEFLVRWPDVDVQLALTDRMVDLVDEGVDVALRIATALPPGLVARSVLQTRYLLVAAPAYLARHGTPREPADLTDHACVVLGYGDFGGDLHLSDGTREAQVLVRGRLAVNNGAAILSAVETMVGIGVLPDFAAAASLAAGSVEQVLPAWQLQRAYRPRQVYAAYSPTRHLPRKVRAFIDHLTGTESAAT